MDHTPNVPRRPVNYVSRDGGSGGVESGINSGGSDGSVNPEHRPLRVYRGDMVKIIDPKSHLCGKYGLIDDEVTPRNPTCQAVVKIGAVRNPVRFEQIRFCTRLSRVDIKEENIQEDITEKQMVNELIDTLDDDIGNRDGANLKHGVKL